MNPTEKIKLTLDIWKKTVDVQQHFNDLELKIRGLWITVLAALLGALAFTVKEQMFMNAGDFRIPIATIPALIAAAALYCIL